jgi:glucosamine kinase
MIDYLLGVDGGGTATRVRLLCANGAVLSQTRGGPSGLMHGAAAAWAAIEATVAQAFADAGLTRPERSRVGIGLGLAGVHNREWANALLATQPGYGLLALETDAFTNWLGAHQGRPGAVVAVGTGSVGLAVGRDGKRRDAGGWGFPVDDEGSGAWLGLQAVNHTMKTMDGRRPAGALSQAVQARCGATRESLLAWTAGATQTRYAELALVVQAHAQADGAAHAMLVHAGLHINALAEALDPAHELPLALSGGLAVPLRPYLPESLRARCQAPLGDAVDGAVRLIQGCAANAPQAMSKKEWA